ncbi:Tn3 family transposase [Paenibacillus ottowii]|uniref:Tn3 family transposase n=1 Tax=Paenibacillus ottowii TaxID=2315729 RepID=UPI003D2EB359
MPVQIGVSALHAYVNPHYGKGKGATIYRFVSDQFSTFYTKVINTNARDAVHVIDGLLQTMKRTWPSRSIIGFSRLHRSSLWFNAFARISLCAAFKRVTDSKLYAIGKPSDFPKLEKLLRGQINTKIIQENYDDLLRLTHSIR